MKQNYDDNEANIIKLEKLSAKSQMLEFAQTISIPAFPNLPRPLFCPGLFQIQTLLFFLLPRVPFFHPLLASHPFRVCPGAPGVTGQGGLAQHPWRAQHPWIPDSSAQPSIPLGEFLACDL